MILTKQNREIQEVREQLSSRLFVGGKGLLRLVYCKEDSLNYNRYPNTADRLIDASLIEWRGSTLHITLKGRCYCHMVMGFYGEY